MRKIIICLYFLFLSASFFLSGCFTFIDKKTNDNAETSITKTFPYIEGSLALGTGIKISDIKVGLFFRSKAEGQYGNSGPKLEFDGNKGRLYYLNNTASGTLCMFTPAILGNVDSNGLYFINMPNVTPLVNGDLYYLVAWNDADNDVKLSLTAEGTQTDPTRPVLTYAGAGEYNRVPVINVLVGTSTKAAYVGYFDKSGSGYEFKYYGVNPFFDNQTIPALTNTNNSNFNFTISNTVDTN